MTLQALGHAARKVMPISIYRDKSRISRRHFLGGCTALACASIIPSAFASLNRERERQLAFRHLHTGEHGNIVYWARGRYLAENLQKVDHLLRDHRTGDSTKIDKDLLDLLYRLQISLGEPGEFQIISAYRSPKTNKMLRSNSRGVAKRSLHMLGKAVDIRLPGVKLKKLHNAAIALKSGGVGYYPKSDFIHIDTGRVRYW